MDVLTKVSRSRSFEKQLVKVPDFIRRDEPLKGERRGQRSVRMNKAYRLIYRVIEDRVHIELLEVKKHEY